MTCLTDLPVELIIEIINEVAPVTDVKATVGNNAAWTPIEEYRASLRPLMLSKMDESDPLPRSYVETPLSLDLLSLRLTCSTMNTLCEPIIYRDLDVISKIGAHFEEWYDSVIKPYAKYARTIRISATNAKISDEQAARIIDAATNADEILLYHDTFKPMTQKQAVAFEWWRQTSQAIVKVAEQGRLRCFGIYANRICRADWHWYPRVKVTDEGAGVLLSKIAQCPAAQKSLKKLDIVLHDLLPHEYDLIRGNLTAISSLTIVHAIRPYLGRVWSPEQRIKWAPNSNLTHLYLKKATGGYAPHIPHLVRHFESLKYLLISICGDVDDVKMMPPSGWYQAKDALWKVRHPLDVLHLEHMDAWEIKAMGEIPTKTLLIANLRGYALQDALEGDSRYFPLLKTIRVEPRRSDDDDHWIPDQFTIQGYTFMNDYCKKRGVTLLFDAKPTAPGPRHA